jgi:hypothetical protein
MLDKPQPTQPVTVSGPRHLHVSAFTLIALLDRAADPGKIAVDWYHHAVPQLTVRSIEAIAGSDEVWAIWISRGERRAVRVSRALASQLDL